MSEPSIPARTGVCGQDDMWSMVEQALRRYDLTCSRGQPPPSVTVKRVVLLCSVSYSAKDFKNSLRSALREVAAGFHQQARQIGATHMNDLCVHCEDQEIVNEGLVEGTTERDHSLVVYVEASLAV